jgi:hypothetical protein
MEGRRARPGLRLFLAALAVYGVCPPFTSYDSYWSVPTALSLLRHGTTQVDEFVAGSPKTSHYALECVPAEGKAVLHKAAGGCVGGHWYNFYPLGVSLLALPVVAAVQGATSLVAAVAPRAGDWVGQPSVAAFLRADLVGGHALVELVCGAFFGALAVWVHFRIAALFLTTRQAVWLTLLFALGTSQWSVASRNLFQHGLTGLLLSVAVYLLVLGRERPWLVAVAGLPLAMAFVVRPTSGVPIAILTLYVAVHERRRWWGFIACAAPVAMAFFAYNRMVRHDWLPGYFTVVPDQYPAVAGFLMHLVSPSHGLLVFTPVAAFSVAGMALAWRRRREFPLAPYLIAIVALYGVLIAPVWEGHCYGPRYWSDITFLFTLFLIPLVVAWRENRARYRLAVWVFVALAAWGVFVHARGATSVAAQDWSAIPASPDCKARAWDWGDPPFLRGL